MDKNANVTAAAGQEGAASAAGGAANESWLTKYTRRRAEQVRIRDALRTEAYIQKVTQSQRRRDAMMEANPEPYHYSNDDRAAVYFVLATVGFLAGIVAIKAAYTADMAAAAAGAVVTALCTSGIAYLYRIGAALEDYRLRHNNERP